MCVCARTIRCAYVFAYIWKTPWCMFICLCTRHTWNAYMFARAGRFMWSTHMFGCLWKMHVYEDNCMYMKDTSGVHIYLGVYGGYMVCVYVYIWDTYNACICLHAHRRHVCEHVNDTYDMCLCLYTYRKHIWCACLFICIWKHLEWISKKFYQWPFLDDWDYSCLIWFICSSTFSDVSVMCV